MYCVRTDEGILVGKLGNRIAGRIIADTKGHWAEKNFKAGKKTVFVIDQGCNWGDSELKLVLWEGFYLEGE